MTYVKQIELAYQEWVKKRQAEGTIKSANTMVQSKFGVDVLTPDVSYQLSKLNEQQLDEFTSKIFEWQDLSGMVAWLENSHS
jgi:hypothetical protein